MHYLASAGAYLAAHGPAILATLAALMSFTGSVKALFSTHPKVEGALDRTLDVLSWVSRAGAKGLPYLGRFSVPLLPSRPADASKPDLKVVP
jgi:hypothetical protein